MVAEVLSSSEALVPGLSLEGHARDAFLHLLQQPGCLASCPDAATAKALFRTVCCSQDEELAGAAYGVLMSWCGLSTLAAGGFIWVFLVPNGGVSKTPFWAWRSNQQDTALA
jgi:hypothetical protein